ncbi:MAG: hypothetical protein EBZ48_06580, partial [Proteobacteria bacterium]|nr:hypothetical protein [Pseudomonadota bacterium]
MLQVQGTKAAEIQELNSVETAAPAPLNAELTAEANRAELAREYAASARASLSVDTLSAENLIAAGDRLITEGIVNRVAAMLGTSERAENDPLIQYAREAWFIKTTAKIDQVIENNQSVVWYPEHVKD